MNILLYNIILLRMTMKLRTTLRLSGLLILLFSLALLLWSHWPVKKAVLLLPVFPEDMQLPGSPGGPTAIGSRAIPEQRFLSLEWPVVIYQGDTGSVTLSLRKDDAPAVKDAGEGGILNLYETHNVMAEARLDIAGVEVAPGELTSISLLPGQSVKFTWEVRLPQANPYPGSVWFYLRFLPKDGSPDSQRLISVQPVEIRCATILGLSGAAARWLGWTGALLGSVLSIDTIVVWGWKSYGKKKASRLRLPEAK